ncbi:MAG: peptide chain release factor-like protein, partial [Dehalococcoidia bacterium]|nr:peptide chain release factor-like protein [Dehalococcoidia bacterium]
MTGDHSPQAAGGWRAYLGLSDDDLLAQCEVDRFRASGPGGQKRNKTDSAVRLRHRPTGLESVAVESRSQHENRARALRRLRLTIALASREAVDLDGYEP